MVTLIATQEEIGYKTSYPASVPQSQADALNAAWKQKLGLNSGSGSFTINGVPGASCSGGSGGLSAAAPSGEAAYAANKDAAKAAAEMESEKAAKLAKMKADKETKKVADELEKAK